MNKCVSAPALRAALASVMVVCVVGVAGAQTVPSPWTSRDVGAPGLPGRAGYSSGVFTIAAAGDDIWASHDQFHFVYQYLSGDVEVIARVDGLTMPHVWAKAGVMIRASLQGGAAHGYALVSAGRGVHFQRRTASGGQSTSTGGTTAGAPMWVRAVRAGTRVTTYYSTNGTSWTAMGYDTIALGTSAYVGVAVTSHHGGAYATARVSNVQVRTAGSSTSLPSGQQTRDIGAPAVAGSAAYSNGTYTVRGAGADIWDTADQFRFVYQQMSGDVEVIARVASLTNTNSWAKAGVMVRESLTAGSKHAMTLVSAANGYAFQRRPLTGEYSEHTSGGSGSAPGWLRLVRTGDTFEAYRSSTGSSWTRIGSDTIPMNDTVYVGLAVTSHNTSTAATAVFDGVRITARSGGTNQPPSVSLATSGSSFTAPASIALTATASDPEGQLARVEFFNGSTRLGSDSSAPYTFTWSSVAAGTYRLTAVAYDAAGASATSASVSVTVAASATSAPRAVSFTASSNHSTAVTSYVLKVYASTANPSTSSPLASSDLGKPTPNSSGTITVDRSSFFSGLAAGTYLATVTAVGSGGQTQSAAILFTR